MADPGFPVGGGGGVDLRCGCFSVKMYVKTKELGPVGGVRWAGPLDLPMQNLILSACFPMIRKIILESPHFRTNSSFLDKFISGSYLFRGPSDQIAGPSVSLTIETNRISLTEWAILVQYTIQITHNKYGKRYRQTNSIGRSRGGTASAPPQQDQFLSFSHTFSSKSVCFRGWHPPQWVGAPPTGNPGSATEQFGPTDHGTSMTLF